MGRQEIIDKIEEDATRECEGIIAAAEETAAKIAAEAKGRIFATDQAERQAVEKKRVGIKSGYAASARLEANKVMLAEKRKVLDEVYARALKGLLSLSKKDCLALLKGLIDRYSEEGDEIVFSEGFAYRKEVSEFKTVKDRGLKITFEKGAGTGAFTLRGRSSDRDLSFEALLAEERSLHEQEVAAEIFTVK